jgi:hypothetical protein
VRRDLHGFVDVDAFHPIKGRLYVQASDESGGHVAEHVAKLKALTAERGTPIGVLVSRAVRAGNIVEIHGWGKRGPRGKAKRWTRRRLRFVHREKLAEFQPLSSEEEVDLAWARRLEVVEMEGEV